MKKYILIMCIMSSCMAIRAADSVIRIGTSRDEVMKLIDSYENSLTGSNIIKFKMPVFGEIPEVFVTFEDNKVVNVYYLFDCAEGRVRQFKLFSRIRKYLEKDGVKSDILVRIENVDLLGNSFADAHTPRDKIIFSVTDNIAHYSLFLLSKDGFNKDAKVSLEIMDVDSNRPLIYSKADESPKGAKVSNEPSP